MTAVFIVVETGQLLTIELEGYFIHEAHPDFDLNIAHIPYSDEGTFEYLGEL